MILKKPNHSAKGLSSRLLRLRQFLSFQNRSRSRNQSLSPDPFNLVDGISNASLLSETKQVLENRSVRVEKRDGLNIGPRIQLSQQSEESSSQTKATQDTSATSSQSTETSSPLKNGITSPTHIPKERSLPETAVLGDTGYLLSTCTENWSKVPFDGSHGFQDVRLPFAVIQACVKCGRDLHSYLDECNVEAYYQVELFNLKNPIK